MKSAEPSACNALLADVVASQPQYAAAGIAAPSGVTVCSSNPAGVGRTAADRTWFQRAIRTRSFAVGDYQIGRASGKPSLGFGLPIMAPDGSISGVAYAAIDLSWLSEVLKATALPSNAVLIMLDRNGTVFGRSLDPEQWVGKSAADTPLFAAIKSTPPGSGVEVTGLDGVRRVAHVFVLKLTPDSEAVYAAIEFPSDEITGAADRRLVRALTVLAGLGLLLLILGYWTGDRLITRPIRRLIALSLDIGAGNLTARSSVSHLHGEIGELAASMDRMAENVARAENELRQSRALLRAVIDSMPATVNVKDRDGLYVLVNRYLADFHGRPLDWFPGKSPADVYPDWYAERLSARDAKILESGEATGLYETEYTDAHGKSSIWLSSATPIHDADGTVKYVTSVGIDITARKQAEGALEESRALLRTVIDAVPAVINLKELDGRYVMVNASNARFHGKPVDWFAGKTAADVFPAEVARAIRATEEAVLASGTASRLQEETFTALDGSAVVRLTSRIPLRNAAGAIKYLVGIGVDITDMKRMTEALQQSEERLRFIVAVMAEGLILHDADGAIIFANASAQRILGLTDDQMRRRTPLDPQWRSVHADGTPFPSEMHPALATLRTGEPQSNVVMGMDRQDGRFTWISINTAPLRRSAGAPPNGVVVTFHDITERMQAEQGLRHNEALLRSLLNHAPAEVTIKDLEGRYEMINRTVAERYHVDPEAAKGKTVDYIYPKNVVELTKSGDRKVLATGKAMVEEEDVFYGGAEHTDLVVRFPVVDEAGKITRVGVFAIDITERKRTEAALRTKDAYIQGILDNMVHGVITINERGIVESINRSALQIVGYSDAEVIGQNVKFLMPEPDHGQHDGYIAHYRESGIGRIINVGPREVTAQRKDGTLVPIELAVSDWKLDQRRVFIGTIHDISQRKGIERALHQSRQRYRHLVEVADVVPYSWDLATGRFLYVGPQSTRILGHSPEELTSGDSWIECVHPDDRDEASQRPRGQPKGPQDKQMEYRFVTPDRREVWVRDIVRIDPGESDAIAYGVMVDVTQSRHREQQLAQAQKMEAVGQLTGGVAHDFNNLLTVIMGNLDMVRAMGARSRAEERRIGDAIEAAVRGTELTHRLLTFSRRQVLRPRQTDINSVIRGMQGLLRRTLDASIEIKTELMGEIWPVRVDVPLLESALLNIAINARDAMPHGGTLTIETANRVLDEAYVAQRDNVAPGAYAMLAVSDTGIGMPPSVVARAFEPFFTTKEVGKGTGLGLSMVFGFVKQSGGHIAIYSEEGHGTTVRIYLPRAAAASIDEPATLPDPTTPATGDESILVVEDDASVRAATIDMLTSLGYRVLDAANGRAALALLDRHPEIDLMLTDVVMPGGMKGPALARAALQRRPRLKVLYMSGYSENAIVHGGILDAGVEWISKPFQRLTLGRRVRELLDRGNAE